MFNLRTNWDKGRLPREEFEYQRYCENGESEEQMALYVFFADSTPQLANHGDSFELSNAEANLK
jgi:hypothetical protein